MLPEILMFLENKYKTIYYRIIDRARIRLKPEGYLERHHIIPKCPSFGGTNKKENLIQLTPKEHYICHLLLMKMAKTSRQRKAMAFALFRFGQSNKITERKMTSKSFDKYRKIYGSQCSGKNNPFYGKTHSPKVRKVISEKNKNWNEIHGNSFLNHKHTDEYKQQSSLKKSIPVIVEFLDGSIKEFPNRYHLGIFLGKSKALGAKISEKEFSYLWPKYNIKNIWRN